MRTVKEKSVTLCNFSVRDFLYIMGPNPRTEVHVMLIPPI